uniref:Uncharacterized protein n=1 Tax=Cacopsylla melanoneura TaxID=428564 RepID=A0A8D9FDZ0_9HEMI
MTNFAVFMADPVNKYCLFCRNRGILPNQNVSPEFVSLLFIFISVLKGNFLYKKQTSGLSPQERNILFKFLPTSLSCFKENFQNDTKFEKQMRKRNFGVCSVCGG